MPLSERLCNHVQVVDGTAVMERGELVKYRQHRCARAKHHRGSHICISCGQRFGVPGWSNGGDRDKSRPVHAYRTRQGTSASDWLDDVVFDLPDGTDSELAQTPMDDALYSSGMPTLANVRS